MSINAFVIVLLPAPGGPVIPIRNDSTVDLYISFKSGPVSAPPFSISVTAFYIDPWSFSNIPWTRDRYIYESNSLINFL